ncbi:hypothetical protein [Streptomyces sp. NPDC059828]|uniref:hypothetical protein n=1 Tax=Streptomyces sp. NPDC059828 TaxID=3346965 RepID=UPI00365D5706
MTGLPVPVRDLRVHYHRVNCAGRFAHFTADFEPPVAGGVGEFLSTAPQEELPDEFAGPLWTGIRQGLDGVSARVTVTRGRRHPADSCRHSYLIAGYLAGRAALVVAGLLPPEQAPPARDVTWPGQPVP